MVVTVGHRLALIGPASVGGTVEAGVQHIEGLGIKGIRIDVDVVPGALEEPALAV